MELNIQRFDLDQSESNWNPAHAEELLANVQSSGNNFSDAMDKVSYALEELDDNWYSDHANSWGNDFAPAFKSFTTNAQEYVNSAGQTLKAAGEAYASIDGSSFGGSWSDIAPHMNSAQFNAQDGSGRRGANDPAKSAFETASNSGIEGIKSALQAFTSAVSASAAYSNANMSALEGTVSDMNSRLESWQDENTQTFNQMATQEIQNYIDTNANVTTAFTGN